MMKALFLPAMLLSLAGCADYLAVDGAGHTTAEPPRNLTPTPVKGDTCHAADLQYLVGHNKDEAPAPVDPSRRRVYCSSCIITMDYRPDRLDIVFDKDTGIIKQVRCG